MAEIRSRCEVGAGLVPARGRPQGSPLCDLSSIGLKPGPFRIPVRNASQLPQADRSVHPSGAIELYRSARNGTNEAGISQKPRGFSKYVGSRLQGSRVGQGERARGTHCRSDEVQDRANEAGILHKARSLQECFENRTVTQSQSDRRRSGDEAWEGPRHREHSPHAATAVF